MGEIDFSCRRVARFPASNIDHPFPIMDRSDSLVCFIDHMLVVTRYGCYHTNIKVRIFPLEMIESSNGLDGAIPASLDPADAFVRFLRAVKRDIDAEWNLRILPQELLRLFDDHQIGRAPRLN